MQMSVKMDYKKQYQELYNAKARPELVQVPPLNYLMIDGEGDPNTSQAYRDSVETLFALSYTLKFMIKKAAGGADYGVLPLEGLWWSEPIEEFSLARKDNWKWTSMIMQPGLVTEELVELAKQQASSKKELPSLHLVRYAQLQEGSCVQLMHTGPYSEEEPTIALLHSFIREQGLRMTGKHHEIYLNDARRSAPERLRTVIRQPVEAIGE
jgi:hypothetical protein